jgi:hypothetical protein
MSLRKNRKKKTDTFENSATDMKDESDLHLVDFSHSLVTKGPKIVGVYARFRCFIYRILTRLALVKGLDH